MSLWLPHPLFLPFIMCGGTINFGSFGVVWKIPQALTDAG